MAVRPDTELSADALIEIAKEVSRQLDLPVTLDNAAKILNISKENLYVRMCRRGIHPESRKFIRYSQLSKLS